MSVPVRSTLRSTLLCAVVPAAIVYAVALIWSGAEGISAKMVLKDLAQSCKAPLGEGFLSSVGYLLWMAAAAIARSLLTAGAEVNLARQTGATPMYIAAD